MAQTFTSTEVVTTTNVFADNQSQRTNENTLRSSFSGATQPSDPVVGQVWYDTANSKQMQYNGTSWVSIDTNGTTQKDVTNAKGNLTSLTDYLRVAHNDDGTLKTSPTTAIDEFKDNALAITYVSTSSFTVPTDLTSIFTANRKVKVYLDGSTVISYVSSSSYSSGDNKTTVVLGGNVLNSSVTAVKYSVIQYGERHDTVHTSDLSAYVTVDSPAFTGTPTGPTQSQFDASTKLATTEFVQRALGSLRGATKYSAATTLTVDDAGKMVILTGAATANTTLTLPAPDTCAGMTFVLCNNNSTYALTLATASSSFLKDSSNWGVSTITVSPFGNTIVVSDGINWCVIGGGSSSSSSSGKTLFTSSGTFTVPAGVDKVFITGCGGGGGGGGGWAVNGVYHSGGGGGGADLVLRKMINVTPGEEITVTIGVGGTGGLCIGNGNTSTNGTAGGGTSFGALASVAGGGYGCGSPGSGAAGAAGGTWSTPGAASVAGQTAIGAAGGVSGAGGSTGNAKFFNSVGGAAIANNATTNGNDGTGFGAGGSGGSDIGTYRGGAGAPGFLLVEY